LAAGERKPVEPDGEFAPMGPTRLRLGKPVIAAVEGHAVAGGMELALWCDIRVAGKSAVMGIFNRRFGVPLVDLGTIRLPRLIGEGRALELILTGRPVAMDEALSIGLVTQVVDDGAALASAVALARTLVGFPQTSMRNDRLSLLEQHELDDAGAIANEIRRGWMTIRSGETLAGSNRFSDGAGRHGMFD
jgi:enoyl-CoA hydratase